MSLDGMKSRREVLEMLGIGASVVIAYPLLNSGAATALLPDPPTFPGQVGAASTYVTSRGTACWMFYAYAGTGANPQDDSHYAKVLVPKSLDKTVAAPTVFVVHGATATEECITKPGGLNLLVQSWLDLGWPVIATREGSTINPKSGAGKFARWGNQPSREGMVDAWRWAQTAWTPDPHGFLVFGFSMGGAGGLNFAAEARRQNLPVGAVYIVDGVTNLAYCDAHNKAFHKAIGLAYGMPKTYAAGDAAWVARIDTADGGHDPQTMTKNLASFPLRLAASSNDPTVDRNANGVLLYTSLLQAGWHSEIGFLGYSGAHCAKSHFRVADVNPFFTRAIAVAVHAPTAEFTSTATELSVDFDASASAASSGPIVAYAWNFGDGATATGVAPHHDYAAPGTYEVVLAVTDNRGATNTVTYAIEVVVPDPDPAPL